MFKKVLICVFVIFIIFIAYQIYEYSKKYEKNNRLIKKIESFQTTITDKNYVLDDMSIERLLDDYNNLKNNG